MFFIIYKTTNKINGKMYIGKHQTSILNDGYLGSGKLLKQAINKYGVENFDREILFTFENEQDMNAKEAELVTEGFCRRDDVYNLCPGGKGGFGYINGAGLNTSGVAKRDYSEISRKAIETKSTRSYEVTSDVRQLISENNRKTNHSRGQKTSRSLKGRIKTEDHKRNISESLKAKGNKQQVLCCPVCGFEGKPPNIHKYHFDRCAGIV
jgi:rubrerythrin